MTGRSIRWTRRAYAIAGWTTFLASVAGVAVLMWLVTPNG